MNRIILNENIILLERTMKIKMLFIMAILLSASCINARTLVVYYSFTNNVHTIGKRLRVYTIVVFSFIRTFAPSF